jgi:hypothetical protein
MSTESSEVPDSQASRPARAESITSSAQLQNDQNGLNTAVIQGALLKIPTCTSVGELLKVLPAPAQPAAKGIFDSVFNASQKLGSTSVTVANWRDQLRHENLGPKCNIVQLNSIKAPNVQISKEALEANALELNGLNLDSVVFDAKKAALTQMILMKTKEEETLRDLIQPRNIGDRLVTAWNELIAKEAAIITTETKFLLRNAVFVQKVSQAVAAIGVSSYEKSRLSKEKRLHMKKEARIDATNVDVEMGGVGTDAATTTKQLRTLVDEALKRKIQSRNDKRLSGKGKQRTGKTSTKKTPKRPGKRQRESASRKANPTGRQPLKRSNAVRRRT